jgi:hypothetical protein
MKNKKQSRKNSFKTGYLFDIFFSRLCSYCKVQKPNWFNTLMFDYACDDCVPRGCSCRIYPKNGDENDCNTNNWDYMRDENGKYLPCEDWERIDEKYTPSPVDNA